MNSEKIQQKLDVLADAAKYDVSCASSGSSRRNSTKGIGVVLKRAKYFIKTNELPAALKSNLPPENLKKILLAGSTSQRKKAQDTQLNLFENNQPALSGVRLQH